MAGSDIRRQYAQMLLDTISDTRFPSTAMLSRIEAGISDPDTLERYIGLLMDRAKGRFPNLQLLDRINGLIGTLERMEGTHALREQAA